MNPTTALANMVRSRDEELAKLHARVAKLEAALRAIIDDASPCASACSRMVDESLIEAAREALEDK